IVCRQFASVNLAALVIERRKNKRLSELPFVQDRVRTLIEPIDAHIETLGNFLRCPHIEVMSALRRHDRVLGDSRFVSRASELRDRALIDILQRRWCEIASVPGVQGGPIEWLVNDVDSGTELVLVRKRVHDVKPT